MGRAIPRSVVTAALGLVTLAGVGVSLTGCSSHHSTLPKTPAAAAGSQNGTTAGQAAGGATNAANGAGGSAAAASPTVLGGGTGCSLLSASDVTNAAGIPLPSMLGNVNGGLQGNTGHNGCLYTKDETGQGADVSVEINTFASGVADQLATLRKTSQDQVDSVNEAAANSASLKDAAVGDGGFEIDYTTGPDETVWFTKGSKLIDVEVNKGKPGAALTLAKIVAGKE